MAMRTASPWWLSLALGVGLLFIFLGERLFQHSSGIRGACTLIGVILVLGVTAVRAWTMMSSEGGRKRVERALLLYHVGTCLSLVLYALSTDWGLGKLALSETSANHFAGATLVLFVVVLVAYLIVNFALSALARWLARRTGPKAEAALMTQNTKTMGRAEA